MKKAKKDINFFDSAFLGQFLKVLLVNIIIFLQPIQIIEKFKLI
jgi:hypothetical protein